MHGYTTRIAGLAARFISFRGHVRQKTSTNQQCPYGITNHSGITSPSPTTASPCSTAADVKVKEFDEIPGPRGPALLPVIGPLFLFKPFTENSISRPDLLAINLHKTYGKIVRVVLPFGTTVLICDPRDMLTVIEHEGRAPKRPGFDLVTTYVKANRIKTLATMDGDEWYHLRMKVQTSFLRPGSADPYVPDLGLVTDDLVTYFERGHRQGDARDVIFLYILECLFQFCFNRRLGALTPHGAEENNETVTQMRALISTLARPPVIKLHRLWKTKAYTNVENSMNHLIGLAQTEVKLAFERLSANQKRDPDSPHLIESLLTQTDLTPEEVVRSMSDFFFGGADTTSKNLGMLLFHMAKYTDQQEMLYQEIKASIGSNILVTPRDLAKMEFMNACVKESMRLAFPLAPGPARVIPQDLVLSGYRVPKGTLVMLCNTACLHDPALVHDPDGFRPERWLRNRDRMKNETIPTVCYLPFGIGVRMCLGKRFAEQIMRLCLVKLVQKYELRLIDDPKDINITYQIFPTIDRPLRIQFIPRPT